MLHVLSPSHKPEIMEDAPVSPLAMAAKSGMVIKLQVKDGSNTGFDVPLKNILKVSNDGILTNEVAYEALRRLAFSALFKYAPSGKVPAYAYKNFDTHFTFQNTQGEEEAIANNDKQATTILEKACAERLLDDNDDVILQVKCTFVNTYKSEEVKKIRAGATRAADHAVATMKLWITKASNLFHRLSNGDESDIAMRDFVVVDDDRKGSTSASTPPGPARWATRFVHYLMLIDRDLHSYNYSEKDHPSVSTVPDEDELLRQAEDVYGHVSDGFVEGFWRISDAFNELLSQHEDVIREIYTSANFMGTNNKYSCSDVDDLSSSSLKSGFSSSSSSSSKASLDRSSVSSEDDKKETEEWKIFFGNNVGGEEVIIDVPDVQDVMSISSDEFLEEGRGVPSVSVASSSIEQDVISFSSGEFAEDDQKEATVVDDDDDDSWAMLDEE